jgi:CRP-like cAMP-binding protein
MNAWAKIDYTTPISVSTVRETIAANSAAKEQARRLLHGLGTPQNHPAGSSIFKVDDNANALYRVESGAVALWQRLPNGKRHIVDFRLSGEYFGVVHRPKHRINAEASSDCRLTAFPRGEVDEICDAVPSFYRSISTLIAEPKVSRNELQADEMRTAKERVVHFLLSASTRAPQSNLYGLPLSVRNIGERIDEPDALVSHCIDDLGAAGAVVRTRDGRLAVLDQSLLQSFA